MVKYTDVCIDNFICTEVFIMFEGLYGATDNANNHKNAYMYDNISVSSDRFVPWPNYNIFSKKKKNVKLYSFIHYYIFYTVYKIPDVAHIVYCFNPFYICFFL